jgi:hypothetical protein
MVEVGTPNLVIDLTVMSMDADAPCVACMVRHSRRRDFEPTLPYEELAETDDGGRRTHSVLA